MAEKHMPWHVAPTHGGKDFDIGAEDGANIALVYGDRKVAALVAAAPETLAMLEQITASANDLLNEMAMHPERQGNWGGLAAHVQMARAVIRAATGEE